MQGSSGGGLGIVHKWFKTAPGCIQAGACRWGRAPAAPSLGNIGGPAHPGPFTPPRENSVRSCRQPIRFGVREDPIIHALSDGVF